MSKGYLVFRLGEFYGILPNKEEYHMFKEQRSMDNYDFVKLPIEEVYEAAKGHDTGYYSTVNVMGYILFPHEEVGLVENVDIELSYAIESCSQVYSRFATFFKFTDEEKDMMGDTLIYLSSAFKKEQENGIFFGEVRRGNLNLESVVKNWVEMIDDGEC